MCPDFPPFRHTPPVVFTPFAQVHEVEAHVEDEPVAPSFKMIPNA